MPPNAKPLLCQGQDECIFKKIQKPVIPKDEGLGAMISAFVFREFGFGTKLSAEELQTVSKCRQGKDRSNRSAALDKRGTFAKQPLKGSPFVA
jgi:hypothetical protein